jgi:regulatory protein
LKLAPEVFGTSGLRVGQEISLERVTALEQAQGRHHAMACAMRLLAYRPRSVKEMQTALQRRRVKPDTVAETIARLQKSRLLDDEEFARSYLDQRDRTSPRSRRLLRAELRAKGVEHEVADGPLSEANDTDAAYRAAVRRARTMATLPRPDFERRLGDFLLRRGFAYETSRETARRLWRERMEGNEI